MNEKNTLACLNALAHETRLDVFRLLVKVGQSGMAAGDIARQLKTQPSTLSTHLAQLTRAGLTLSERSGRVISYRVNFNTMAAMLSWLLKDCCRHDQSVCKPLLKVLSQHQP